MRSSFSTTPFLLLPPPNMPSKLRTPPPLSLLLLLLLFPILTISELYNYSCLQQQSSCGNLTHIHFPFWFANDSTTQPSSYCGHPDFMLICLNNSVPILRLATDNYTVIDINYDNYTISLADFDIFSTYVPGGTCPGVRHNLTFYYDFSWDYAPSDINLTFFFNCTGDGPAEYEIPCLAHDGKKTYVLTNDTSARAYDLYEQCGNIFLAPVLQFNLHEYYNLLGEEYGGVLHDGFQLTWPETATGNCGDCEGSGGRCGLNQTSGSTLAFTCFCKDGITSIHHCKHKNKKKMETVIGVSVSAGLVLLLCAGLLFYWHKKKRARSLSNKSLFQNVSSKSSSKDPEKGSGHFQTHIFSYAELEEATNCFDASKELGDGGFGTVYKGKLQDGRTVAVKRLYENNYRQVEQFKNEIEILTRLRHQNLVDLYGCTSRNSRELLLVYEFVPNGTVADHLHGSRASEGILTWPMRLNIAIETADALAYLHAVDPPIIHRDVKTSNILLDGSFHVKVADFGLSRLFPTDVTHISTAPQGTPGYLDPEYHQCYQLTDKSDVYSFGVVLIELISSKPAVDITRHRREINLANMAINRIQNGELDQLVDEGLGYQSDEAVRKMITMVAEVAFRCLQLDGEMRPPIKEALEVLRAIQSEGYKVAKEGKDAAENKDDAGLLKNIAPMSPDSVMNKWVSRSTTPNTSE